LVQKTIFNKIEGSRKVHVRSVSNVVNPEGHLNEPKSLNDKFVQFSSVNNARQAISPQF
jgi:hypothetical protein